MDNTLTKSRSVELRVKSDSSGRLTLTKKLASENHVQDCKGELWSNADKASFFRAVAQELLLLHKAGESVSYQDSRE